MFKKSPQNIFKISSYIQKTTTDPIDALKITIYITKHTKNTKIHFTNPDCSNKKKKIIIYQSSIIRILCIYLYILYISQFCSLVVPINNTNTHEHHNYVKSFNSKHFESTLSNQFESVRINQFRAQRASCAPFSHQIHINPNWLVQTKSRQ
jgi:hypothetical protein